ncbi:hypothetical protein BASU183_17745 [Bacillus subtilis]
MMLITILLFLAAGLAEIGGGYLVWLWLREAKPAGYGIAGALILIVYGILPTFQSFPSFGRRLWRSIHRACGPVGMAC